MSNDNGNENEYRIQAMNRKQAQRERRRLDTFGDGYKRDNLNGGRMRQEYLDEIEEAREAAYNHTLRASEGFTDWMTEAYKNQRRERQERRAELMRDAFPERESLLTPMDEAIHEQGAGANYYNELRAWKKKAAEKLFPESETERRRDEHENNRHPMDDFIRKQLEDRRRNKSGAF